MAVRDGVDAAVAEYQAGLREDLFWRGDGTRPPR